MKRVPGWLLIIILFTGMLFPSCRKSISPGDEKFIALSSPTGGEVFIEDGPCPVRWNSGGVSYIDIVLLKDDHPVSTLAKRIENTGNFGWTVDYGLDYDSDYQVRISDSDDDNIYCETGFPIRILPRFEKSSFIDERDGREYKTVKIGDSWWMAENFRYEVPGSRYYNDVDSLGEVYGRLYSLEAARGSAPAGWHLPTDNEWKNLESYLGMDPEELDKEGERSRYVGRLLKTGGGSGFDALYGGYENSYFGRCAHIYQEAHIWSATLDPEGNPLIRIISSMEDGITRLPSILHSGCSVRYVKDSDSD